ncbi:MAG: hypothetical protein ACRD5G_11370 [Candidatus Acidiferrales bacterium]
MNLAALAQIGRNQQKAVLLKGNQAKEASQLTAAYIHKLNFRAALLGDRLGLTKNDLGERLRQSDRKQDGWQQKV